MNKPFTSGLVIGRFQVLHKGHESIIRTAIALCDETLLFIGSAQESGTDKNPFSYETRKSVIETVFAREVSSGVLKIRPLNDIGVGNNETWGKYLVENAKKECDGKMPKLLVSGKEERRINWFDNEDIKISELYIPKTVSISASHMRRCLIENDRDTWERYTSPIIWDKFDELRQLVLISKDNLETLSI